MSGDGFQVDLEELDAFARKSRARGDRFEDLRTALQAGEVGRRSFGVMPASFSMHRTYQQFLDDCLVGLRDTATVMNDIADELDDTRLAYADTERDNSAMFRPGEK
jgi:hypothetical protein